MTEDTIVTINREHKDRLFNFLYSKYIADNSLDIFGETIIQLPVPKLVVFYNGDREVDDETTLRLSDSFLPEQKGRSDIEVKVRILNINSGHNDKIFQVCKPLSEYSWLIDRIKKTKKLEGIENAVTKAIDQMPNDFEIKGFLISYKQEVIDMMLAEEQEINALELIAKANEKKGTEKGIRIFIEDKLEDGIAEDVILAKLQKLYKLSPEKAKEYYDKEVKK